MSDESRSPEPRSPRSRSADAPDPAFEPGAGARAKQRSELSSTGTFPIPSPEALAAAARARAAEREEAPPALPRFIERRFAFERRIVPLARGVNAGLRLHLVDHGPRDAPAVVLLHGNPTWSFLWRKVIRRLEGFRCIAPDLLGLGLSSHLPALADHTLDRHAAAIAELLETLEIEHAVGVAQDWGGPILTTAGSRVPERIRGWVIANTAVVIPDRPKNTAFHRFARRPLLSDLVFRGLGFPLRTLHKTQGEPESISGDVARAYRWPLAGSRLGAEVPDPDPSLFPPAAFRRRVAPLALARMVPDSADHPSHALMKQTEAWLREADLPICFVWGEKDPILGRALRRHREAFPDAPVTLTPAGHFLQEEVPDELAAAVRWVAER